VTNKLEERRKFIINVLYFALAAALLYFGVKYLLIWLLPFLIGFFVSLLLRPIIGFISARTRIPNKVVAPIIILLFYAVFGVLLTLVGIKLVLLLKEGFASLPTIYKESIEPLINTTIAKIRELTAELDPETAQYIDSMTASLSQSAGSLVTSASSTAIVALSVTVSSVPGFLLAALFTVLSSFFFTMDFSKIAGYVEDLLPDRAMAILHRLRAMVGVLGVKYVKSYAILMSVTFIELAIGFFILGLENAVALAALVALIDLLPVLGTGSVVIPWAVIELVKGNYGFATGLAIMYIVILVVRNILEPKIVGGQIGVHPLAMLISMYLGLQIFGFIGIFVLPILLVVTKSFYDSKKAENCPKAENSILAEDSKLAENGKMADTVADPKYKKPR
jgi:sporulation integral membrane protein YtvI